MIEALKYVGLYDKVMKLPQGINTQLTREFSEEGVVLSGGEIQKIAVARAYASKSSLLIFDEPSSALDPISEFDLLNKMLEMSRDKCAVIISHHLRNIKNVNHIYVFHNGLIAEHGTHDKLMKEKGLYYTMYNKQTREINDMTG